MTIDDQRKRLREIDIELRWTVEAEVGASPDVALELAKCRRRMLDERRRLLQTEVTP